MLYALLCYNSEDDGLLLDQGARTTRSWPSWPQVQDAAGRQGKLGPSLRLMPTTAATTLRKGDPPLVIDGPFAETKEQLLGFYVLDCDDLEEALDVARDLGEANPGGAYEIRPLHLFCHGALPAEATPRGRRGALHDRPRLDRRGADLGAAPGGRRPAALFPRPRHRRGGLQEACLRALKNWPREGPAARPGRLADHGRPQRRARRRAPQEPR